jgi:hypothetical protein
MSVITHDELVEIAIWLDTVPLKETTKSYVMLIGAILTILDEKLQKAIKEKNLEAIKEFFENESTLL